ncbi:GerW family sporulation protein [Thermodesulfobacteriota bacterium]
MVPLSRVSIGFGGGGGEGDQQFGHGKDKKEGRHRAKGIGLGSGGGAKVRPVAVIVFTEDGVRVEEIPDKRGPFDKIFNKIPDIIEFAKKHK